MPSRFVVGPAQPVYVVEPSDDVKFVAGPAQPVYCPKVKMGVFAYLLNPTITTTTPADTYVPITGPFLNVIMERWQLSPTLDCIEYIGKDELQVRIHYDGSFQTDTANTTFTTGIKHNGYVCPCSECVSRIVNVNGWRSVSNTMVRLIKNGDCVQLVIKSNQNGAQLTTHKYTTDLSRFFG